MTTQLQPKHIRALKDAVTCAADWRGSLVGNPDETDLNEFDAFIKLAKQAVRLAAKQNREVRSAKR